jgi:LEA14-like dessication related protein
MACQATTDQQAGIYIVPQSHSTFILKLHANMRKIQEKYGE